MEKCIWNMGNPCDGEVTTESMFASQINITVCAKHWEQHKQLMFLNAHDIDVDKLLALSLEDRTKLFKEIRAKYPDDELIT